MPINIITVEEARPKRLQITASLIKSTKTYNEVADMIRSGHIPDAISVTFTEDEIKVLGLKNPYHAAAYHLQRVAKRSGQLDIRVVGKKCMVTIYREKINGKAGQSLEDWRKSIAAASVR